MKKKKKKKKKTNGKKSSSSLTSQTTDCIMASKPPSGESRFPDTGTSLTLSYKQKQNK